MPEYVDEDGTREVTVAGSARDRELQRRQADRDAEAERLAAELDDVED